ncbi:DsbA family protein [Thalassotalea profundi]|uniref:Thioredoxin n=1 Tax=Thalassotalea profundi TaxID=2036687 RepID=A0ABQ3IGV4_9GAMM|nr:thioredoxin domain-containing protein [Thalassotalea profundi]GHE80662.1 thioredoxin [Thalassotalea profundi]
MIKRIALTVAMVLSSAAIAEDAANTTTDIESLKREVAQLKRDMRVVISNQQALAEHTGLIKKNDQQAVQIGGSATLGKDTAKVVLIEFTDLHCPFCKKFNNETLPTLKEKFIDTGKIFFVGKHYPITSLHKNAYIAAKALECARSQKIDNEQHYTDAKNWLFNQGSRLYSKELSIFANEMELEQKEFDACMESDTVESAIDADIALVKQLGLSSTPAFAIGLKEGTTVTKWKTFTGAKGIDNFTDAIEQFLAIEQ